MPVSFVDLAAHDADLTAAIRSEFDALLQRADWILGEQLAAFEQEFAAYCGARHAVGTDSGLSALELALRAYGIGAGDEVITTANTFIATALAISHTGAHPVLVDVDPVSQSLDPALLDGAVTERTRAIVPVHLHGRPAEMNEIVAVARTHRLLVIEDACQAHGARYWGQRAGSFGDAAAFSFYPAKNLGAYGDGGMVVTDDSDVAETIRLLRHYGQRSKHVHELRGFNRRLDTLQAAILRLKLRRLDGWNEVRRNLARLYSEALRSADVGLPPADDDRRESVWHLYVIQSSARDELQAYLSSQAIETAIHYPTPIHLQPAFRDLGYPAGSFPVSERLAAEILSLPMHPSLTPRDVFEVAAATERFAGSRSQTSASEVAIASVTTRDRTTS